MKLNLTHKKALIALSLEFGACKVFREAILKAESMDNIVRLIEQFANDIAERIDVDIYPDVTEETKYNTVVEMIEHEGIYGEEMEVLLSVIHRIDTNIATQFNGTMNDEWKLQKLLENWEWFSEADIDELVKYKKQLRQLKTA